MRPRDPIAALRLALAAVVLASHSYPLSGDRGEPVLRLTGGRVTAGTLAVLAFLALSGYLVALSWSRDPAPGRFLLRRARRILPGFLVASAASAFVVPTLAGTPVADVADFAPRALLLMEPRAPGAFPGLPFAGAVNGSLWSIRYEWGCYLLLAALGVAGLLRPRVVAALGCAALVAAVARGGLAPPLLVAFFAGAWLALRPRNRRPVPARGADLSYGLYLYAFPVQQLIVQRWGAWLAPWSLTVAALAVALPLAWLSWHLVERPCLHRANPSPTAPAGEPSRPLSAPRPARRGSRPAPAPAPPSVGRT